MPSIKRLNSCCNIDPAEYNALDVSTITEEMTMEILIDVVIISGCIAVNMILVYVGFFKK